MAPKNYVHVECHWNKDVCRYRETLWIKLCQVREDLLYRDIKGEDTERCIEEGHVN